MSSIIITPENVHQITSGVANIKTKTHPANNNDLIIVPASLSLDGQIPVANKSLDKSGKASKGLKKPVKKKHQVQISSLSGFLKKQPPEEEIKLEWTSPNYEKVEMFGGLYRSEKGERKTIIIRGKKGFCESVVSQLSTNGNIMFLEQ